jgi:two-component system response regulator HydG
MEARILVIDDEESIRFTFQTFLANEGYEVLTAGACAPALEIIGAGGLDLIFSDILLGEVSGLEILQAVADSGRPCPVIMITGQPAIATAAESVRLGAFDYLLKPIRKETLLKATHVALRHRRLLAERDRIQAENDRYRLHLDAIFRSVAEGILTVDHRLRVTAANQALETVCGLPPEALSGRHLPEVDNPCLRAWAELLAVPLTRGAALEERTVTCRPAGQPEKTLVISARPLQGGEGPPGAILVIRDITRLSDLELRLAEQTRYEQLVGNGAAMQEVYRLIRALAGTDATVLITGESGTGKNIVAKALHASSPRAGQRLMTVNCSALAEDLLESELFGHVRGAFTGAVSDKVGRFEACQGGSLLLDEIGEIPPRLQVKLLRVIQDREFERVGESVPRRVDVRIMAATNRDLRREVASGRFRQDLYYRLNVVEIPLPALRQRREDIPLLVRHFRERLAQRYGKSIEGLDEGVRAVFEAYAWPGNVRELEHALEHAFVLCEGAWIGLEHLPAGIRSFRGAHGRVPADGRAEAKAALTQALQRTGGNKARAARLLGISRQTLYRRLGRLSPDPDAGSGDRRG